MTPLPDLVKDWRLKTAFKGDVTRHVIETSGRATSQRKVRREQLWRRTARLGEGSFGVVWKEVLIEGESESKERAVKMIRKHVQRSRAFDYSRELEAIAKFSHPKYNPFFVESYGWFESDDAVFITMEFFPHGDLEVYLSQKETLPEPEVEQIAFQVLEGLSSMHENGFAHRDLKPGNILIKVPGPTWWVKIGDFGNSKRAEEGGTVLSTLNGTPGFLAPEILVQSGMMEVEGFSIEQAYTHKCDIWSMGEIIYRTLCGESPFLKSLVAYVRGTAKFPLHRLEEYQVSREGIDFIENMMQALPEARLTAVKALEHPWLAKQHPSRRSSLDFCGYVNEPLVSSEQKESALEWAKASAVWSTVDDINTVTNHGTQTVIKTTEEVVLAKQDSPYQSGNNSSAIMHASIVGQFTSSVEVDIVADDVTKTEHDSIKKTEEGDQSQPRLFDDGKEGGLNSYKVGKVPSRNGKSVGPSVEGNPEDVKVMQLGGWKERGRVKVVGEEGGVIDQPKLNPHAAEVTKPNWQAPPSDNESRGITDGAKLNPHAAAFIKPNLSTPKPDHDAGLNAHAAESVSANPQVPLFDAQDLPTKPYEAKDLRKFPRLEKGGMRKEQLPNTEQLRTAILSPWSLHLDHRKLHAQSDPVVLVRESVWSVPSVEPPQSHKFNEQFEFDPSNEASPEFPKYMLSREGNDKKREDTLSNEIGLTASKKHAQTPKGILRRPTEKFSVKRIYRRSRNSLDCQWTKINRSVVEPVVLKEANLSNIITSDAIYIYGRLTREEIQRLFDQSSKLREQLGISSGTQL